MAQMVPRPFGQAPGMFFLYMHYGLRPSRAYIRYCCCITNHHKLSDLGCTYLLAHSAVGQKHELAGLGSLLRVLDQKSKVKVLTEFLP